MIATTSRRIPCVVWVPQNVICVPDYRRGKGGGGGESKNKKGDGGIIRVNSRIRGEEGYKEAKAHNKTKTKNSKNNNDKRLHTNQPNETATRTRVSE